MARSLEISLWWYDFASIWHDIGVHGRLAQALSCNCGTPSIAQCDMHGPTE